jgi:hypothetical protein
MFEIRISSRGSRFASETNTQMTSGTIRIKSAHYKDLAGAGPASARVDGQGGRRNDYVSQGTTRPEPEFVAFVGIDWADQKHVWCLQEANSGQHEAGELKHRPEAVEAVQ